jgi:hypothetical protein
MTAEAAHMNTTAEASHVATTTPAAACLRACRKQTSGQQGGRQDYHRSFHDIILSVSSVPSNGAITCRWRRRFDDWKMARRNCAATKFEFSGRRLRYR